MIQKGLAIVQGYIATVNDQARARIPIFEFFVYFFFNGTTQNSGCNGKQLPLDINQPSAFHSSQSQQTMVFRLNPACCLFL